MAGGGGPGNCNLLIDGEKMTMLWACPCVAGTAHETGLKALENG